MPIMIGPPARPSRVLRSGVQLLATPSLVLQLGDRLTVVGEAKAIYARIVNLICRYVCAVAVILFVIEKLLGSDKEFSYQDDGQYHPDHSERVGDCAT